MRNGHADGPRVLSVYPLSSAGVHFPRRMRWLGRTCPVYCRASSRAPYHAAAPAVPPGVQDEVERVRQAIMSGAIDVDSPYQFRVFLPMVEFIRRLP